MQPAAEDQRRGLAVHVTDCPAPQREVGVAGEAHHGCEVEPGREPRDDLMDAAALDLEGPLALEHAHVVVDGLAKPARMNNAKEFPETRGEVTYER